MTSRGFCEIWIELSASLEVWAKDLGPLPRRRRVGFGAWFGRCFATSPGRLLDRGGIGVDEWQNGRLQLDVQVRRPKGPVPCPVSCAKLTSHIPSISDESRLNGRPDCCCPTARHVSPMPQACPISMRSFA